MSEDNSTEITYSSEIFNSMDTNGDKFVTTGEMADFLKKNSAGLINDGVSEEIMKIADIDGNSKMSLGEFALAAEGAQEINRADFEAKYGSEEAKNLFDNYDKDKDGKITSDEIKAVDKENDKSKSLSTGAIVGIVIGAVCLVGLIVGLIVYFSRNKKTEAQKEEDNKDEHKANNFDGERKDIKSDVKTNLNSVNKQKSKDNSVGA